MLWMILNVISAFGGKNGGLDKVQNKLPDIISGNKEKTFGDLNCFPGKQPNDEYIRLAKQFANSIYIDEKVIVDPVIGSVVYCNLVGFAEHTGIYVGNGNVVHLNGDGAIEMVSRREFTKRLDGLNPAVNVYVSCYRGTPVGSYIFAERALSMIGRKREYNFIFDNCHQFSAGCINGDFNNHYNFFFMMAMELKKSIDFNEWGIWRR